MRKSIIIALSVLGGLVIVLAMVLVFVLGRNSKPEPVPVITTSPTTISGIPVVPPSIPTTTATTAPTPKASTKTVYVKPKTPKNNLTRCQQMYRDGYSYAAAYQQWMNAGYPASWDVDHDGYPCEQSFGNMN